MHVPMFSLLNRKRVRLLISYSALIALLLVVLSACGRNREEAANPTPTAIATLAAEEPAATPEAAPTDTPAPAETPAEAEAETTDAGAITDTASLTATEEMTGVAAITEAEEITSGAELTEEVTPSDEITATVEMTATPEMGETEDVSETEEITSTGVTPPDEITSSGEVTETDELAETEEMTGTEEITDTDEITETEDVSEGDQITETSEAAEDEEEDIAASDEITATEEVTSSEEMTATEDVTGTEDVSATEEMSPTEESMDQGDMEDTEAITETETLTSTGAADDTDTETSETAARLFFLQPNDNAILPENSTVVVGYEGLELLREDEIVEGAGHLYLLVDADFVEAGEEIPEDETLVSPDSDALESGEVTTAITLTPGLHVLRLQFVDGDRIALEGDQYRRAIIVRVVDGAPEQSVRFVMPTDGAEVPPSFDVVMAASGLIVEPSGPVREDAGHFHIMVDEDFVVEGEIIPIDETHLHFGTGALTATLELEPGEHVLRLQFANGIHRALDGEEFGDVITVTVAEDAPAQQVMFVEPQDGESVPPTFPLKWAAAGLIIEPAGPVFEEGRGHLHVLVDEEFAEDGEVVPADETHIHFGAGQTSTEMTLEPGEHTLRLQMADGTHRAYVGEEYQDEITITVEEE